MFDVEYLPVYKFSTVNRSNGARRQLLLGPYGATWQCKDIATEIHPHYYLVFQRLDCFLSEDI